MQRVNCVWLVWALACGPAVAAACDGPASGAAAYGIAGYVVPLTDVGGSQGLSAGGAYVVPQAAFVPLAVPYVSATVVPVFGSAVAPLACAPLAESCTEVRVLRQRSVRRPVRIRQRIVTRSVLR